MPRVPLIPLAAWESIPTVHSVVVVLTLMFVLVLSVAMFYVLLWRESAGRRGAVLAEWARAAGFHRRPAVGHKPPAPLGRFAADPRDVRLLNLFDGKRCAIVRFVVTSDRPAGDPGPAVPGDPTPRAYHRRRHVLVWPIETDWPTAALRPAQAAESLVDLLGVPPQPSVASNQRFVVHAADRRLAATVAGSSLRGLLPADIGLILIGRHVVLDFSARPFDPTEFNRMIAVAEQMVANLPLVGAA